MTTVSDFYNSPVLESSLTFCVKDAKSEVLVTDGFRIQSAKPMPNWWRRFWYFSLLGWRWRKTGSIE